MPCGQPSSCGSLSRISSTCSRCGPGWVQSKGRRGSPDKAGETVGPEDWRRLEWCLQWGELVVYESAEVVKLSLCLFTERTTCGREGTGKLVIHMPATFWPPLPGGWALCGVSPKHQLIVQPDRCGCVFFSTEEPMMGPKVLSPSLQPERRPFPLFA